MGIQGNSDTHKLVSRSNQPGGNSHGDGGCLKALKRVGRRVKRLRRSVYCTEVVTTITGSVLQLSEPSSSWRRLHQSGR